jgi:hypothetical protein
MPLRDVPDYCVRALVELRTIRYQRRIDMKRGIVAMAGLTAIALLAGAPAILAQQHKPDMHMHKSELAHRPDKDVAAEYKTEAEQLREKAKLHRELAAQYRIRTPHKSGGNYASVAKHCDQLASAYENAAKTADEVSAELAK